MKLRHNLEHTKGFTILELLLSIAIVSIIAALASPFLQSFQLSADIDAQTQTIVSTVRRAQQYAVQGRNASSWGVYFDTGSSVYTLFRGDSYALRTLDDDQQFPYNQQIAVSTTFVNEIVFNLSTGMPSATGTISLLNSNNELRTIIINSAGIVDASF